jgi:hypothetical protein
MSNVYLIRLKQTGRAKDYAAIGELARELTPARELALTTDVDRILELARRSLLIRPGPACGRRGKEPIERLLSPRSRRRSTYCSRRIARGLRRINERPRGIWTSSVAWRSTPFRSSGHMKKPRIAETLLPNQAGGE